MASDLETTLLLQLRQAGLLEPVAQYRLPGKRRHLWDFAWPERHLLVDVQGGGWVRGRHHRPAGYREDCVKANIATLAGWRVLRVDTSMVEDGSALATLRQALQESEEKTA